jgi:predicted negative regulator of RcsB-dependent stress response
MGNVLAELGQTDEAKAEYERALRFNPQSTAAKQALDVRSATPQR